MGWTNPPLPARGGGRTFNVVAVIVGAVALGVVGLAVAGAVVVLSGFGSFGDDVDLYKPTAAESRAAATTVPISAAGCAAFARVEKATLEAGDATEYQLPIDLAPKPTPQRSLVTLGALHTAVVRAIAHADGPMRQRLRNFDRKVRAAQREVEGWNGVVPPESLEALERLRDDGYTELRIAERLLGHTCGGRLAPAAARLMFGQCFYEMLTSTTRPETRTTSSVPTSTTVSCHR